MLNADHLIVCSNTLATLGFQYRNHRHDTMPIPNLTPSEGETYDANQKPPPFGHALKHYFALDDDYVNLNHGTLITLSRNVSWPEALIPIVWQVRMGPSRSPSSLPRRGWGTRSSGTPTSSIG